MNKVAFLGAGNIAYAIAGGLVESGVASDRLIASDPSEAQLKRFSALGIKTTHDNLDACKDADIILIAVKPNLVKSVAEPLADSLANQLVVSVAAGITASQLRQWFSTDRVIRCMPNTPALIGEGMTGLYATATVTEPEKEAATQLLAAVGGVEWFDDESLMDAVTAVSGSGPAYFFLVMEAMESAAREMGLDADVAARLVQQTALGAARMALTSHEDVAQLRQSVTSPGGTTAAAVDVLESEDIVATFGKAMIAARDRSIEMSTD